MGQEASWGSVSKFCPGTLPSDLRVSRRNLVSSCATLSGLGAKFSPAAVQAIAADTHYPIREVAFGSHIN